MTPLVEDHNPTELAYHVQGGIPRHQTGARKGVQQHVRGAIAWAGIVNIGASPPRKVDGRPIRDLADRSQRGHRRQPRYRKRAKKPKTFDEAIETCFRMTRSRR